MPEAAGYSGTPLVKKLGIRGGCRLAVIGEPAGLRALLQPLPATVLFQAAADAQTDIAHLFVVDSAELARQLGTLRSVLRSDAALWVSWPKKAAKVPTNITEEAVRAVALPLGFVDIKVCAVDAVWSGLKLVVRKSLR